MGRGIEEILIAVEQGRLSADVALQTIREGGQTDLGWAVLDDDREARTGAAEVVFGAGKRPDQLVDVFSDRAARAQPTLATRVSPDGAEAVLATVAHTVFEPVSATLRHEPEGWVRPARDGRVAVVSAGSSDAPMAGEAVETARWYGWTVDAIPDVGVAGLHRLLARLERIRGADVVIVVAGMEGALPSVVAGLVRAPVVAVPTSVGVGAHLDGLVPLLAMVNSCSAGVAVVNVDGGFQAASVAHRILQR